MARQPRCSSSAIFDDGGRSASLPSNNVISRRGQSVKELLAELGAPDDGPGAKVEHTTLTRAKQRVSIRGAFMCMFRAAVPFFRDPSSRGQAWCLAFPIVALIVLETKMTLWGTDIGRDLDDAIGNSDRPKFRHMVLKCCFWLALSVPVHMVRRWFTGCFALEWRRSITTRTLEGYVGPNQAYYLLKFEASGIDNPDQRVGEDVGRFTNQSVVMMEALVVGVLTIINCGVALYNVLPDLLFFVIGFTALLTFLQLGVFGSRLMFLQRMVLAQEADLRYGLMRVREHGESIAFYRGADAELGNCMGFFNDVVVTSYRKLRIMVLYHGVDNMAGVGGFSTLLPYMITVPKFFRNQITIGQIYMSINLYAQVYNALATIISQLDVIADLGANAIRVQQFSDALEELTKLRDSGDDASSTAAGEEISDTEDSAPSPVTKEGIIQLVERNKDEVAKSGEEVLHSPTPRRPSYTAEDALVTLQHVTLYAPGGGQKIVSDLSFQLRPGESLLIMGESGCGKSSLLRAIAGLWKDGSGCIERSHTDQCIFLSQDSYLCLGSLRENVMYPNNSPVEDDDTMRTTLTGSSRAPNRAMDPEVKHAIAAMNIEHLSERYGLDVELDFDSILSGGEKQRLCLARVLLRGGLELAMLDEATTAVDMANEARVYEQLRERVPCYISVGHSTHLEKFHTHKLVLRRVESGGCTGIIEQIER